MQKLIKTKKKTLFEEKLKANVGKPKELWKALKSLGLPSKNTASINICLEDYKELALLLMLKDYCQPSSVTLY